MSAAEQQTREPASAPTANGAGRDRRAGRARGPGRLLGRLAPAHVLVLVAALVAAVANFALLRSAQDTTPVLVADAPLEAGETLRADAVTVAEVAGGGPVAEALLGAEDRALLDGAVVARPVERGEPLRASDLRTRAAPEGLRAMSVPVARPRAVGGALQAGDRVDVIETDDAAGFLARDLEVLAVPSEGQGGVGDATLTLTLAVDEDVALGLAEALHGAELDIVRSTGSTEATRADAP